MSVSQEYEYKEVKHVQGSVFGACNIRRFIAHQFYEIQQLAVSILNHLFANNER